jgi:hypothetical protein
MNSPSSSMRILMKKKIFAALFLGSFATITLIVLLLERNSTWGLMVASTRSSQTHIWAVSINSSTTIFDKPIYVPNSALEPKLRAHFSSKGPSLGNEVKLFTNEKLSNPSVCKLQKPENAADCILVITLMDNGTSKCACDRPVDFK